jgi:hypothetical protein
MLLNLLPLIALLFIAKVGTIIGGPPNARIIAVARTSDTTHRSLRYAPPTGR